MSDEQHEAYKRLPKSIKLIYSVQEWLWLSAKQKKNLEQTETEPECE